MADKQYRATITIATDATVIDKTARANMGTVDDLVEKLLADHADSAITITVTEAADIVTVRAASAEPRKPRGSAVKDELAALKAQIAGLTEVSAKGVETKLAEHLPEMGNGHAPAAETLANDPMAHQPARKTVKPAAHSGDDA